ncbi:MAG: hypothetical protein G3I09_08670 [Ferrovum sp.]|nr:hypothetical protein [Ferrovum sp.]
MTTELKEAGLAPSHEVERLVEAARDSLTDDMVSRLAGFCGEGLDLVDRASRSGLAQAIPLIADMVHNGDLERISQLARVYQSAQDALTDEMVGRLAETMGEGLSLLDRLNRGGAGRLVQMLEQLESTGALEKIANTLPVLLDKLDMVAGLLTCLESAATKSKVTPTAGGIGNLWQLMTNGETQQSLQFLVSLSQQMQDRCAKAS